MGEFRKTLLRGVEGPLSWSSLLVSWSEAVVGVWGVSGWSIFVGLDGGREAGVLPLSVDGDGCVLATRASFCNFTCSRYKRSGSCCRLTKNFVAFLVSPFSPTSAR